MMLASMTREMTRLMYNFDLRLIHIPIEQGSKIGIAGVEQRHIEFILNDDYKSKSLDDIAEYYLISMAQQLVKSLIKDNARYCYDLMLPKEINSCRSDYAEISIRGMIDKFGPSAPPELREKQYLRFDILWSKERVE